MHLIMLAIRFVCISFFLLCPCFGKLSSGAEVTVSHELMLLEPFWFYPYAVGAFVVIALVFFTLAANRWRRAGKISSGVFIEYALVVPILSAAILFIFFPYVFKVFYRVYLEMEADDMDFPVHVLIPLRCASKVGWAMLLAALWLVVQPVSLRIIRRKEFLLKPMLWPAIAFLVIYSLWFVFSLFKPLVKISV